MDIQFYQSITCIRNYPPPPTISNSYAYSGVGEYTRTQSNILDIVEYTDLYADFSGSIRFPGWASSLRADLNLNGNHVFLDSDGIVAARGWGFRIDDGIVTSSGAFVNISLNEIITPEDGFGFAAVIADNGHAVGLRVSGNSQGKTFVHLQGSEWNTFSGDTIVSGAGNTLVLNKDDGVIAVSDAILVENGGRLAFRNSGQVSKNAKITLRNGGELGFSWRYSCINNTFGTITVEGEGCIDFYHKGVSGLSRFLYLDDMIITDGSLLRVKEWVPGEDHLLVSRNIQDLDVLLSKIEFEGYSRGNLHLEDFDENYWEISGLPEASIYGAVLGGAGIGVVVLRRRWFLPHPVLFR